MYRHSIRLFLAAVGTAALAAAGDPGMPVAARVRIVPAETQIVPSEEPMDHYVPEGWSEEESHLLMKIAMAEAEGEDTKGKPHGITKESCSDRKSGCRFKRCSVP